MDPSRRLPRPSISRRGFLAGGLGSAGVLALAACSSGSTHKTSSVKPTIEPKADGNLNWFSWEGYVDPTIVSDFEKKYSVKVTISAFDSNDTMIQKLAAGLPYDVITNNSGYMSESIQGGLVQPFELSALTHSSELVPFFQKPSYDNGANRYSVPYSGGPTGIVYRTDKMQPTHSWDDLWNNKDDAKRIFVLDYIEDAIGASLLRKGFDVNSGKREEVVAATDALISLKSQLGGVSSDSRTNVGNGTAWIHQAWVPDAFNLMTKSKYADKLQFETTPKQGVPSGIDVLTVGAKAKSPGTALLFIDWMLAPENLIRTAKYTAQLSGTKTGDAAYTEAVKNFPGLQVPDNYYENALYRLAPTGARRQLWTEQWNRFKAS